MAFGSILIFLTALVTVTFIFAENDSLMGLSEDLFEEELKKIELEEYSKIHPLPRNRRNLNISLGYLSFKSCNFSEVGIRSCASCTEALFCPPLGIGISRNCGLLGLPCNNGHCSLRTDTECAQELAEAADAANTEGGHKSETAE